MKRMVEQTRRVLEEALNHVITVGTPIQATDWGALEKIADRAEVPLIDQTEYHEQRRRKKVMDIICTSDLFDFTHQKSAMARKQYVRVATLKPSVEVIFVKHTKYVLSSHYSTFDLLELELRTYFTKSPILVLEGTNYVDKDGWTVAYIVRASINANRQADKIGEMLRHQGRVIHAVTGEGTVVQYTVKNGVISYDLSTNTLWLSDTFPAQEKTYLERMFRANDYAIKQ